MNTKQQEFDAVVAHLYKQGKPASEAVGVEGIGCKYRLTVGEKSLSCAVGCRIPDDIYVADMDKTTDMSNTTVRDLVKKYGDVLPPEIPAYVDMFSDLQGVHDSQPVAAFDLERLSFLLSGVATKHGLTFTAPQ